MADRAERADLGSQAPTISQSVPPAGERSQGRRSGIGVAARERRRKAARLRRYRGRASVIRRACNVPRRDRLCESALSVGVFCGVVLVSFLLLFSACRNGHLSFCTDTEIDGARNEGYNDASVAVTSGRMKSSDSSERRRSRPENRTTGTEFDRWRMGSS
jgi:hypothetical protein